MKNLMAILVCLFFFLKMYSQEKEETPKFELSLAPIIHYGIREYDVLQSDDVSSPPYRAQYSFDFYSKGIQVALIYKAKWMGLGIRYSGQKTFDIRQKKGTTNYDYTIDSYGLLFSKDIRFCKYISFEPQTHFSMNYISGERAPSIGLHAQFNFNINDYNKIILFGGFSYFFMNTTDGYAVEIYKDNMIAYNFGIGYKYLW